MSAFSTKPNTLKKIGLKGVVRLPFYGFGSPKETLTTPFRLGDNFRNRVNESSDT